MIVGQWTQPRFSLVGQWLLPPELSATHWGDTAEFKAVPVIVGPQGPEGPPSTIQGDIDLGTFN